MKTEKTRRVIRNEFHDRTHSSQNKKIKSTHKRDIDVRTAPGRHK